MKWDKVICKECGEEVLAPMNNKKHGTINNGRDYICPDCRDSITKG